MKATAMTDGDLRDQIARLESDIEHLAEGLERCRKAMLFSMLAGLAPTFPVMAGEMTASEARQFVVEKLFSLCLKRGVHWCVPAAGRT